jgi:glycosyltransferase involved in cell wall biosynthesis
LRIVHIITRLIVGGAQENTLLTCEGLASRGHEVTLLSGPTTGPEGSLVERARRGPYEYEELPDLVRAVNPWRELKALRALRRRIESIQPDVVHTHSSKAGILGRLAAHRAGVPIIVHTIHGMSFNRTQSAATRTLYAMLERHCAGKTHRLVSVADAMTRQSLAAGIGAADQYVTIRSGMVVADFDPARVDGNTIRKQWGLPGDAVVVGTVARLFENKGYEQLIEIIALAVKREPRLRFVWIGGGAHRHRYEAALQHRDLSKYVKMIGLIPPDQMPQVLAGVDLLAHTSQWEGLPRAVVQSLLMERPAVSFDIDGAPEVIEPGVTGSLVALGDLRGFADALVELANDTDRRKRFGQAGRSRCLREFDHQAMVDRLEVLYQELQSS